MSVVELLKETEDHMNKSIEATKRGEEEKIAIAMGRMSEEDPTLVVERRASTGETVLLGLGELRVGHLAGADHALLEFGSLRDLHSLANRPTRHGRALHSAVPSNAPYRRFLFLRSQGPL